MRVLDDGVIIFLTQNGDLGTTAGIVDDLINEGVKGKELAQVYNERVKEMDSLLKKRETEGFNWARANPRATEDFLRDFMSDAELRSPLGADY